MSKTSFALVCLVASCGVREPEPPVEPLPVPFVVSDYYSPDGVWGDGEVRGSVVVDKTCTSRAPDAQGDCYTITYTPGDRRFAGIDWQYPHNNWGKQRGLVIAPGAHRITFAARGEHGGEAAKFSAGQGGTNMFKDEFQTGSLEVVLTQQWLPLEIPLPASGYASPGGVIGAFVMALEAGPDEGRRVLFIDDIRWQP